MGTQLMSIVAEGKGRRIYLSPTKAHEDIASQSLPGWIPDQFLANDPRNIWCVNYGLTTFGNLFTQRQLAALTTFCDLVQEVREQVQADASKAGLLADGVALKDGGKGAQAYADAVATYLAFAVDRSADFWSTIAVWSPQPKNELVAHTFMRQALPMAWDFAEANPFSESSGNFGGSIEWVAKVVDFASCNAPGLAKQRDATTSNGLTHILISTDPPYYDNISYADLSDFFYVWLRRSLSGIYPELFQTMLVPKAPELVATPYRFGGSKSKAQKFFEDGLEEAFRHMRAVHNPEYPMTVYYAFKQAETEDEVLGLEYDETAKTINGNGQGATASTGWETMLEGLIRSGFAITGTWPMRTERPTGVKAAVNVLASSIVLVCRPRPVDAEAISQREFLRALRAELPRAMREIQHGSVAAVDFEQACIGPGMAIFSRYSRIEDTEGKPMRVRVALQFINRTKDEILAEQEGEYDAQTQWAVKWFEQYAMKAGPYGDAETLSKARNTSVASLEVNGLVESRAGKVRLHTRTELPPVANLGMRANLSTWEVTQRMIHELDLENKDGGGEVGAAHILRQSSEIGELARDLAYRLYTICERNGWTQEAMAYNSLVTSWSEITRLVQREVVDVKQTTIW
ncbi:hypothetical protein KSC_063290 [Ktedonobacter sp. SOSP1-52]|nr:hypothetical protein KSC_063290 [Ktedonobacter sp. SOSP1-52]